MKDKYGNALDSKEFLDRWKAGIKSVTPLQSLKIQMRSTYLMLIGLMAGIVISIINIKTLWWLGLILIAALINTFVQLGGQMQKRKLLESIENTTPINSNCHGQKPIENTTEVQNVR